MSAIACSDNSRVPPRRAQDQNAIGDLFAFRNQGPCPDKAVLADPGTVQHRGAHTDQGLVADRAAVQHRLMSDGAIRTDCQRKSRIGVQDRVFLDIAALPHSDALVVTAQRRTKPDRSGLLQFDVSDHIGAWRDPEIARCRQAGRDLSERV